MSTNIEFDAIAAMCNETRGIAKNNALPWSVSNDYEYFKRVVRTTRDERKINAMIIGRLSWESLSIDERPILPGLTVIISSKMSKSDIVMSKDAKPDSVVVLKSIDQAIEYIKTNYSDSVETIYSLGGSEIYRLLNRIIYKIKFIDYFKEII
jgi:dihydrofolate reductase